MTIQNTKTISLMGEKNVCQIIKLWKKLSLQDIEYFNICEEEFLAINTVLLCNKIADDTCCQDCCSDTINIMCQNI